MKFKEFRKKNVGLLLILPWWIGFAIFKLYPFISSLIYSFHDYNLFRTATFSGLSNYKKILGDPLIMKAFIQTFKYAFLTVPLELIFALFIAYILNFKIKGVNFFRTAYYIPSILGGSVSIAVLWRFLFKTEGLVNMIASRFGIQPFNWLGDPGGAFWVIVFLKIWQFGSPMIIFLAAIKQVPQEMLEAAAIDGASKFQRTIRIMLPMISPIILFNLIMQIISAFKVFTESYIISGGNGGVLDSLLFYTLHIYNEGFGKMRMGYASALAWFLVLIIAVLTALVFGVSKKFVHYD